MYIRMSLRNWMKNSNINITCTQKEVPFVNEMFAIARLVAASSDP
jgi:hypothetical protein